MVQSLVRSSLLAGKITANKYQEGAEEFGADSKESESIKVHQIFEKETSAQLYAPVTQSY